MCTALSIDPACQNIVLEGPTCDQPGAYWSCAVLFAAAHISEASALLGTGAGHGGPAGLLHLMGLEDLLSCIAFNWLSHVWAGNKALHSSTSILTN